MISLKLSQIPLQVGGKPPEVIGKFPVALLKPKNFKSYERKRRIHQRF